MMKAKYAVDLFDDGKDRYYTIDKQGRYPGVTTILGIVGGGKTHALIGWAKKEVCNHVLAWCQARANVVTGEMRIDHRELDGMLKAAKARPTKIKDAAADLGTRAHAHINGLITGNLTALTEDIKAPVAAFIDWQKQSGFKVVMPDTKVASKKYGFGGSMDALFLKGGKYYIGDWKTSNKIRETYALQAGGGYAIAFEETYGIKPAGAVVVRFGKDNPSFEVKIVRSLPQAKLGLLAALTLFKVLQQEQFIEEEHCD